MSVFKISGGKGERLSPEDRKKLSRARKPLTPHIRAAGRKILQPLYAERYASRSDQGPRRYDYEYDDLQTLKKATQRPNPKILAPWEGPSQFQI